MKPLTLVLMLAGIFFQHQLATATSYDTLYVRSDGLPFWPCGRDTNEPCKNIATAVQNAKFYNTATIKVAQGEYLEWIYIDGDLPASLTGQLSIEGGWSSDFTSQSHDPALTRVAPSIDSYIINVAPGTSHKIGLRLAYLTFQGTKDTHPLGLSAYSSNSTVDLTVEHCRVLSFRGQGVSLRAENNAAMTVTLHDTVIQGNYTSSQAGAGVYVASSNGSNLNLTMSNNMILGNQAKTGGGIYFVYYSNGALINATLTNNILAENRADENGGAIRVWAGDDGEMELTMTNNTINWNFAEASSDDGGISFYSMATGTLTAWIKNTIVWGNGTDIFLQQVDSSSIAVTSDYSIIGNVENNGGTYTGKSSNLNVNPLLNADYHLTGGSPAKDKGICGLKIALLGGGFFYSRIAPYDDIDGDLRPGYGIISGCDIGADEYRFPWILFNPAFIKQQ